MILLRNYSQLLKLGVFCALRTNKGENCYNISLKTMIFGHQGVNYWNFVTTFAFEYK